MILGGINTAQRVLIVAEIGNNHEGDVRVAERLIDEAARAGVDAVKFQTFRTEQFVRRSDAARFARLKQFELRLEDFARLAQRARAASLLFLSTPLDLDSAAMLAPLVDAYKIASGDNTFTPLIEQVALTGKPLIVSCGIARLEPLTDAITLIRRLWRAAGVDPGLAALHCVSAYPVPPEQVNLVAIATLRDALGCTIGYSDHTLGIEAAVLAVAAGARIIEKHFTLAHDYSDFRDHQLSADPGEMAALVRRVRAVEAMLGDGRKVPQACERAADPAYRRSIAARMDLPAGHVVARADLTWTRPGGGVPPGCEAALVGQALTCEVRAGEPIRVEMLRPATSDPTKRIHSAPQQRSAAGNRQTGSGFAAIAGRALSSGTAEAN